MKKLILLCVLMASVVCGTQAQQVAPFKDGERAVFLGNSITDGGHYHSYIWLYYMTRFPFMDITVCNAGIGGDTAADMFDRLDGDVFDKKPTVLMVTFGMNDTGYFEFGWDNAAEATEKKFQQCYDNFKLIEARLKTLKLMPYIYKGYVGRIKSVSDYYQRSMELLDPAVRADLFNDARPIRTKDMSNPSTYYGPDSKSVRSLVADGCFIEGEVENCIISRGVTVEKGAKVFNSILMHGTTVKSGASLSYVIADKNVTVNEDCALMGHFTYPLAIAKGSVV